MEETGYQYNRIIFTNGKQALFLISVMKNLKLSQRKISNLFGISRSTFRHWLYEDSHLPENILKECIKISPQSKVFLKFVTAKLPRNWGQIKGGKKRSKMKTNLNDELRKKAFKMSKLQRKTRRVVGPNGELMFNAGEKRIAEVLTENKITYKYEPLVTVCDRYFYPDFLVGKTIIERCGYSNWDGYWFKALRKFRYYDKFFAGKVIMIISADSFKFAYARVENILRNVKNIIIIKENEIELLPRFITGL